MEFFIVVVLMIIFAVLAYWKGNPVLFMLTAGTAIMAGLYMPDALPNFGNGLGFGIGLMLIMYSFVNVGLAFANSIRSSEED